MGDPELHGDEKILLTTQDVFVKSIPFEAVLTNKRIILIDRKKNLIPPKDILLATIRDIEGSENAIRDQIITLSLITSTGETRQLVLTFSRMAGGGRKRERDDWLKALKEQTSSSIQKAIRKVVPTFDQDALAKPREQASPKIGITSRPAAKKEIEGAHPIKKIVETGNVPPKPVETTSLPTGSFCNRCGNRVPPDSAFCNRCGAQVSGQETDITAPGPVVPQVPVEVPVPAVQVPPLERKERPIDREIQSIEPLIEGSVPRKTETPPVEPAKPAEEVPADAESSIAKAAQSIIDAAAAGTVGAETPAPESGKPAPSGQHAAPGSPATPPPTPGARGSRRRMAVTAAVAVIVIIALAGGAFVYWNYMKGGGLPGNDTPPDLTQTSPQTTVPTPAPVRTTVPMTSPAVTTTAVPTTAKPLIPKNGVWIRVVYPGTFRGTLGTAADQQPVSDTGDKFYSVATSEGIVQASIQKSDGSGDELVVEVYKNGSLVKRGTTTVPRGVVEVQADLKPPRTTTVPATTVTTPPANITTTATTVPATTTTTIKP